MSVPADLFTVQIFVYPNVEIIQVYVEFLLETDLLGSSAVYQPDASNIHMVLF